MQVPEHWEPRGYQLEFLRGIRNARIGVLEWARRSGKTMTVFNYSISRMVEEVMTVVIVYPTLKQGYKSFWTNIENDGFKTIDHIPKSLILRQSNTDDNMRIEMKNGSVFMLLGADNPEALRGANGKIYIFDECVDINGEAFGVVRPITALNGGQLLFTGTPKIDGISGATFVRMRKEAEKAPDQYASMVDAHSYMSDDELEKVRQDYIVQYGNDFKFRQEFLLDEGAALATSYYGNMIDEMTKDGRIGLHPYDPKYPVYTAWDLGMSDSTALFFWQYHNKKLRIIDVYETHDVGDRAVVGFVKDKPYVYAWHFFPHDGAKRDSDAVTRIQKIRELGLLNASLLTRHSREDGIEAVAELLHDKNTTFHQPTTGWAVDKLVKYSRKYNPLTGDYEGHDHKTESHIADAMRYIAEAIRQAFSDGGDFFYENAGKEQSTHSEELVSSLGGDDYATDDYDF
jgi:hypothetical protein